MKICLLRFDAKRCFFKIPMNLPKEEQVKICQNMKCPNGSITERKINGEVVAIVSCDFTWNPFDSQEVTEREYSESEGGSSA